MTITDTRRAIGVAALVLFALTVVAANAALDRWGFVAVGFGLTAPAGVYFAGLAFQLRDVGQEHAGIRAVFVAIAAGTILSALVDPALAVASGSAFAVAEMLDLAIYTPLRLRSWSAAVVLSGLAGSALDSVVFLWLAPFPVTARAVAGLVLGKAVIVFACMAVMAPLRSRLIPAR